MTRNLTLLGYAAIVIGAVVVELVARRRGAWATFGETMAVATRRRPVRLVLVGGWLWLGWHLFVRVDWA